MLHVVCPGECCVDWYADDPVPHCGGITFNVALHATRAFAATAEVTLLSAIGDDAGGTAFREALSNEQVRHDLTTREGRTPSIRITLDDAGERHFDHYDPGALLEWQPGPSQRHLIAASDLMVTTCFTGIEPVFARLMALPAGGLRAVDFADVADSRDLTLVERFLDDIDIGFFGIPASDTRLRSRLERLAARSGKLFVLTFGAAGSLAIRGDEHVQCDAMPVDRVVDTTGAGDCFAAWFLARYMNREPLRACLEAASAAAAEIIRHAGTWANLPADEPSA